MSKPQPLDDSSLIERIKTGLPHEAAEAFEQLVTHHAQRLFNYLRFKGLTSCEQEDISNETWLRAWENISRFEYRGIDLFPWLRSIANNITKEHYRAKVKEKMLSIEEDNVREKALAVADPDPPVLEQLINTEIREEIEQSLKEAPSDYRELINAKFFMDFKPEEIAQLHGWSMCKVYTTTNRAITWLKKRLTERFGTNVIDDWLLS